MENKTVELASFTDVRNAMTYTLNFETQKLCFTVEEKSFTVDLYTGRIADFPNDSEYHFDLGYYNETKFGNYEDARKKFNELVLRILNTKGYTTDAGYAYLYGGEEPIWRYVNKDIK